MNETPDSDIIGKAKTELRDLLVIVAPNLTPMDTLSGLISQINNVLAWLRDQIPKTTNEGRALPAEPFIMRLGMNFTITPKNVILWPKEKATGRSALGVFEDAIAALLQPATPPAELAALRAEVERLKAENENLRVMQGARTVTLGKMQQQLTAAVTRAERAEGAAQLLYDAMNKCERSVGNIPGHCHLKRETWDGTNRPCLECQMWNHAMKTFAALAAARDAKGEA
jgi:hypothetical protein